MLADLSQLNKKYDSLLTAQERTMARYKQDYRRWKAFKSWLSDEVLGREDGDNSRSRKTRLRSLAECLDHGKCPNKEDKSVETRTKQNSLPKSTMNGSSPDKDNYPSPIEVVLYQDIELNNLRTSKTTKILQPINMDINKGTEKSMSLPYAAEDSSTDRFYCSGEHQKQSRSLKERSIFDTMRNKEESVENCIVSPDSYSYNQNNDRYHALQQRPSFFAEEVNSIPRTPSKKGTLHTPLHGAKNKTKKLL